MKLPYSMLLGATLSISALNLAPMNIAHAHNFQNDACDVQLQGDIFVKDNTVRITTEAKDVLLLSEAGEASLNGKKLTLTAEQAQTVKDYVQGIEAAIPQALALAARAIDITNEALTEVFTGLLGEDSRLPQVLNEKLNQLQSKLEEHVYQDKDGLRFDSAFFGANDSEQTAFEKDLDAAVEEVMSSAMAELLITMGKSMLSGGGNMQDFEQRMSSLGENIEQAVEQESQKLKTDALELCEALEKLDEHERKLQEIDELKHIDFLRVKNQRA